MGDERYLRKTFTLKESQIEWLLKKNREGWCMSRMLQNFIDSEREKEEKSKEQDKEDPK